MSNPTQPDGLEPTSPVGTEDLPPDTLIGEYKIETRLGQGGMGTVYAARHPVIGKRVAVKVLSYFFSRDAGLVRRFTDEARAVNKIGHPNIIDVFSFGRLPDGRQYFVMEYLEGETMTAWLERGRPAQVESRRFLLQTCEALEAAHREGIVHRDLKPDNIWIARPKHGEPYIKVLDFGLAKLMAAEQEKSTTRTGTVMGTPQFMSPEQCVGRGVDHRTDIYALGAIIFRVYCGRLAFDGGSSAEIIAAQLYQPPPKPTSLVAMSSALETLILDCLDKDPARRPASAAELGVRLREATQLVGATTELMAAVHPTASATAETQKGYATNQPSTKPEAPARGKRKWLVVAAAAVIVAAGATVAVWRLRRPSAPSHGPASVRPVATTPPTTSPKAPIAEPAVPAATPGAPKSPVTPEPAPTAAAKPEEPAAEGSRGKRHPAHAKAAPAEGEPSPAATEGRRKPSRAAREGLIQENPF